MYSTYAELLSFLLIIAYLYRKTKERITLWVLSYILFLVSSATLFRVFFPNVPFFSPTLEYTIFLIIVGIPFLVLVVLIGAEIERRRTRGAVENKRSLSSIFKLSKDNIIFWTIIVLINLVAFLLEKGK